MKYNTQSKVYRYQFEINATPKVELPKKYKQTSSTPTVVRYQTNELKLLISLLEEAEDNLKEAISPFLRKLFTKFYKKKQMWSDFIRCISEIDCLVALSEVAISTPNMTKPKIIDDVQTIEIKQLRHP